MKHATLQEWQSKQDIYNTSVSQNTLFVASYTHKQQSYLTATYNNNQFTATLEHLPHASFKTQLQDTLKTAISLSGMSEGQVLYTAHPHVSVDRLSGFESIYLSSIASDKNLAFDLLQPYLESERW